MAEWKTMSCTNLLMDPTGIAVVQLLLRHDVVITQSSLLRTAADPSLQLYVHSGFYPYI